MKTSLLFLAMTAACAGPEFPCDVDTELRLSVPETTSCDAALASMSEPERLSSLVVVGQLPAPMGVSGSGWFTVVTDLGADQTALELRRATRHAPPLQVCRYTPSPENQRACAAHEAAVDDRSRVTTLIATIEDGTTWSAPVCSDTRELLHEVRHWNSEPSTACAPLWEGATLQSADQFPARTACVFTQRRSAVCRAEKSGGRGGFGSLGGP